MPNVTAITIEAGARCTLNMSRLLVAFPNLTSFMATNAELTFTPKSAPYLSLNQLQLEGASTSATADHFTRYSQIFPNLKLLSLEYAAPALTRVPCLTGLSQLDALFLRGNNLTTLHATDFAPVSSSLTPA